MLQTSSNIVTDERLIKTLGLCQQISPKLGGTPDTVGNTGCKENSLKLKTQGCLASVIASSAGRKSEPGTVHIGRRDFKHRQKQKNRQVWKKFVSEQCSATLQLVRGAWLRNNIFLVGQYSHDESMYRC